MSCCNNKINEAVSWLCPYNETVYSSFTGKKTQKPISVFDHFYSLRNSLALPSLSTREWVLSKGWWGPSIAPREAADEASHRYNRSLDRFNVTL